MTTETFRKSLKANFSKGVKGFTAIITTDVVDRDGEVLIPQGCHTKEWEANPVLHLIHSMSDDPKAKLPIGKGVGIRRGERHIEADFEFAPRPDYYEGDWLPDYARGLVESGCLAAVSVGANYMERGVRQANSVDRERYGPDCQRVISRWKLHEVSLVAVPANPEALVTAVHKGLVSRSAAKRYGNVDVPAPRRHVVRVSVPSVGIDDVRRIARDEVARIKGRVWSVVS